MSDEFARRLLFSLCHDLDENGTTYFQRLPYPPFPFSAEELRERFKDAPPISREDQLGIDNPTKE